MAVGFEWRTGLIRGAEIGGWKVDFNVDRTNVMAGSATLASRSTLLEITFLAQGNVEALVGILKALAPVVGDVGLMVLSTRQSATSPTVKEEPLSHSAYSI